jgi:glucose/arabinose dehydrogenase
MAAWTAVLFLSILALDCLGGGFPPVIHQVGYTFDMPYPDLPVVSATGLTFAPGDTNRLFVLAKNGQVLVITNRAQPTYTTFLDLSTQTYTNEECGLLGLAFHPQWATNGQVYVFYSTTTNSPAGSGLHERISRFSIDPADPNHVDPATEIPLITQYDRDPEHNGGDLHFGPDGYLYASVGDEGCCFDVFGNSQKIDGNFFSAILRIDVDRLPGNLEPNPHPAVNPGTYRVPADNPWIGATNFLGTAVDPGKVRSEFYAVGFRNPYRFRFDPANGDLYVNDVGQSRREEVNLVHKGDDCGWVYFEGSLQNPFLAPPPAPYVFPLYEYEHEALKIAVVGGVFCRDVQDPAMEGGYFFLDFGGAQAFLRRAADGTTAVNWLASDPIVSGLTDVVVDPASGELLCSQYLPGSIWRFRSADNGAPEPPATLGATGLFSNLATLAPADGVTPYDINLSFWSDGAEKRRWFQLPATNAALAWRDTGAWDAPAGTVFVKHFDLNVLSNGAAATRRIETRVLVRTTNGVYGVSYRWDDAGVDATAVAPEGAVATFATAGGPQRWVFPARAECGQCHNPAAGHLLGLTTAQLNKGVVRDGGATNQIAWLAAKGLVSGAPSVDPVFMPRLADAADPVAGHAWRARSYLAANCSACHRPGGPTRATWDARAETSLLEAGILQAPALENLSDLWNATPNFVADAGSPATSAIYIRLSDLASYHMPPLATTVINSNGVALIADWITHDLTNRPAFNQWITNVIPSGSPTNWLSADATPAGDGISNEGKWLLQEPPIGGTNLWRLTAESDQDGVHLKFQRKAELGFTLESAPAPGGPWATVLAPGNEFAILSRDQPADVLAKPGEKARFFRVRIFGP